MRVVARALMWRGLLWALVATRAAGQGSALEAALAMPERAEVVLVADGAADWRGTPAGEGMLALLATQVGAETRAAFDGLAGALGVDQGQAFDLLFGRRVTFVAEGVGGPTAAWSVAAVVSPETANRLREALKASPREVRGGLPWLAIERGRFQLVVVPGAGASRDATVVLAPRAADALMHVVARSAAGEAVGRVLAETPAAAQRAGLGEGRVAAVYRGSGDAGGEGLAADGAGERPVFVLSATPEGAAWRVRAAVAPVSSWAPEVTAGQVGLQGKPEVRLGERGLAALVVWPGADPGRRGVLGVLPGVPLETVLKLVVGLVGDRVALVMSEEGGLVSLDVAARVADVRAASVAGDAAVASTMGVPDFLGVAPEAARQERPQRAEGFPSWVARGVAQWRAVPGVWDRSPVYGRAAALAQEQGPDPGSGNEPGQPVQDGVAGSAAQTEGTGAEVVGGVWLLRVGSVQSGLEDRAGGAVRAAHLLDGEGPVRARLTTGTARPAALARVRRAHDPGLGVGMLDGVEHVAWDVWVEEGSRIMVELTLELVAPPR